MNRISSSMPDKSEPLLEGDKFFYEKVIEGENDGVDIIEDEKMSKLRSNSWLSSSSTKT